MQQFKDTLAVVELSICFLGARGFLRLLQVRCSFGSTLGILAVFKIAQCALNFFAFRFSITFRGDFSSRSRLFGVRSRLSSLPYFAGRMFDGGGSQLWCSLSWLGAFQGSGRLRNALGNGAALAGKHLGSTALGVWNRKRLAGLRTSCKTTRHSASCKPRHGLTDRTGTSLRRRLLRAYTAHCGGHLRAWRGRQDLSGLLQLWRGRRFQPGTSSNIAADAHKASAKRLPLLFFRRPWFRQP